MIPLLHILAASLLCIGSLFVSSSLFTDSQIVPKWVGTIAVCLLMVAGSSCCCLLGIRGKVRNAVGIWGSVFVLFCCLQALYGILQFAGLLPSPSLYPVTGSFDNPAGFASCLCIGIPLAGLLWKSPRRSIRYAAWVAVAIMIIAVVLSESRAGMVSIGAVAVVWLWRRLYGKYRWGRYALLVLLLCLSAVGYWMKKDSADGRLLIWRCSLNMAMDAPLLGHGLNSFEAHYMDYQAAYFGEHGQQSRFALLADNVKQPFNEYLHVWLNFGIAGLAALAVLAGWLIRCYRRHPSREKRIAACALLSVGIFSLFSYPFTYPFTWIVVLWCIGLLAREPLQHLFRLPKVRYAVCAVALVGSLGGMYLWNERFRAELAWNRASNLALMGKYQKALPEYQRLEASFADNPYFLYNYAAILQEGRQYAESQRIASQCRRRWADYDLELILGENCQHLQQPEQAVACYRRASQMCPLRFLPLYKLFRFHKERGEREQMEAVAREMLEKPVKIKTPAVLMMRREAERSLASPTSP